MTKLQDPLSCLHVYLLSIIQQECDFVFLRQSITRISQIKSAKPVPCCFSLLNNSLLVKQEGNSFKSFPLVNFEKIQWGQLEANTKFISITLRNDRSPIVLYGKEKTMELWFDGLNLCLNTQTKNNQTIGKDVTNSSLDQIDIFTKALSYASTNRNTIVEIPPSNAQFNPSFL